MTDVGPPEWKAGYAFAYTSQGSYSYATAANGHSQSDDNSYGPVSRIVEVLNTTLEAHGEPVFLIGYQYVERADADEPEEDTRQNVDLPNGMSVHVSSVSFMGIRKADLHEVNAQLNVREDCGPNGACNDEVTKLEFDQAPEFQLLEFPLEKGKKWSGELEEDVEDFPDDLTVRFTAKVDGMRTVEVPAGRIQAVKIDVTFDPIGLDEYEEQARKEASEGGVKLEEFDLNMKRSGTLYYSAEYQTFVKTQWTGEFGFRIRGTEPNGESFNFHTEGRDQGETVLDGAQFTPNAERGLDYLGRLYSGKVSLRDATGQIIERQGYALNVKASKLVVNVAEPEAVQFTAAPEGLDALPDGHTIRWIVNDYSAKKIATGNGASLTFKPEEPGEYIVEAIAEDGVGNRVSTAAVTLAANYQTSVEATCPPVSLTDFGPVPLPASCSSVPVPVRPGAQFLRVAALVEGPLSPAAPNTNLFDGEIVLADAAGQERTGERVGNRYVLDMDSFWRSAVSDEDWSLEYAMGREAAVAVTYEIDLRYDGTVPDDADPSDESTSTVDAAKSWIRPSWRI